jgi:energy-coupling factor transporter ATP-binding protein EcfA2
MIKLQWLQINKFRKVKPGTRLAFDPVCNVILGQSGTGKSTLLELVAALFSADFSDLLEDEFDLEYEFSEGEVRARFAVRHEHRPSSAPGQEVRPVFFARVEISFGAGAPPLTFVVDEAARVVRVEAEVGVDVPLPEGPPVGTCLWSHLFSGLSEWIDVAHPRREILAHVVLLVCPDAEARRFDESLEFYSLLRQLDIGLVRGADGTVRIEGSPLGQELAERVSELAGERWDEDRYVLDERQLPFLSQLASLLDFETATAVFEFTRLPGQEGTDARKSGRQAFHFTHRAGWKIPDRHLSYGQKRMLAFLYYLDCVEHVAIADELVNGLPHPWLPYCIEALSPRQLFLTSPNPILLDALSFESPEDVRSQLVLCRWEDAGQMCWENPAPEVAEDFLSSHQAGFQQLGELLLDKGLG